MAKPEWITLDPMSGSEDGSVQVTVPLYTGRSDREGTITAATSSAQDTSQVVQHGKAEFITADETSLGVGNGGGTAVISGTSNSANIKVAEGSDKIDGVTYKIEVNEVEDNSWNGNSDTGIDGDPGASAEFVFEITATFPANQGGSSRTHKVTLQNGDVSVSSQEITITQASGTMTYADPIIDTISYATDVPAEGGSVTPEVTYSQTWGWNGATTGGGTITSGGTLAFTGDNVDPETGEVTGENLGTTVKERTKLATVSVTVTLNGKTSAARTADAYQEANSATYGEVAIGQSTPVSLQAAGQSYQINPGATQTVTYTSGASRNQGTSGNPVAIDSTYEVKTPQDGFSLESGTVTVTENPGTSQRGGFVVIVTSTGEGGKTATKNITFNQQGSESTIEISPEKLTFEASGGTQTFTITSNDSWTIS